MNHGLDIAREMHDRSHKDWLFGAASTPCRAKIPRSLRAHFLPEGESQHGKEDMMDCASRGPLNILEMKYTYLLQNSLLSVENEKFLRFHGYVQKNRVRFSDAFVAILSGTNRRGNSMKAPLEAIRRYGLVPKSMLPYDPHMTWDEYHDWNRITPKLRELGREFTRRFTINYERIYTEQFSDLLVDEPINVAGYAWPVPDENGHYGHTSRQPNHVFILYQTPRWHAYDNYRDSDGDFQKYLTDEYAFLEYGYRVYISSEVTPVTRSFWSRLVEAIREFVTKMGWWRRMRA